MSDEDAATVEAMAEALVGAWGQAGKDFLRNRQHEQEPWVNGPIVGVAERWMARAALTAAQKGD